MSKSCALWIAFLCLAGWTTLPISHARGADSPKFSGEYDFFSGEVGEKGLPTNRDAKVGLYVSGALALRMYQYMGRSAHINSCAEDNDDLRLKGDLLCSRNKTSGKAQCSFGIDLHSGKSVASIDPC